MLLKTVLFTILVPGSVTILIPLMLLPHPARTPTRLDAVRIAGWILIGSGAGIYFRCAWDFATVGRGTPAPVAPPEELVVRGPYRFVRNPMYVGILLILAGEAVLFESLIHLAYASGAFVCFHLFVVLYEEPALARMFGRSYERYRGSVPRWIPSVRRRTSSGVIGLVVMLPMLCGCGTYGRMLRHGWSGVVDYRIFPGREIRASPRPFEFRDKTKESVLADPLRILAREAANLETILRDNGTLAFLVIRDDAILYERYFHGFARDRISLGFSMTKSVLSLLIGCAVEDGLIGSVEEPITRYLPELRRHGFDKVTLRHLLMSTSGLDYAEDDNPFGIHAYLYYCERCIVRRALSFRLAEDPGRRFVYKSGDNILLATALRRALGSETITAYLQRRVWDPLGMEGGGIWSTDGEQEKSWCCLAATARDFAKFGMLYLREGRWNGKTIIGPEWVRHATSVDETEGASPMYQFQWWHPFRDRPDYMMAGHLGQYVYVHPGKRVVVVRLGTGRGNLSSGQWWNLLAAVSDAVRPPPSREP